MAEQVVQHGLEGVIAFETQIAEPDREGSALRYRGVDIEDLVGSYDYGHVWGLLVDGSFDPGLPPAEPFPIPVHSGDIRVDPKEIGDASWFRFDALPPIPPKPSSARRRSSS